MLCNSMAAAGIATGYVLALFLHLNPHLPLHPARLSPIVATVGLFYAVHLTVIFYVLLVVWQLLAREVFSPAWISVGVLTLLCGMASTAGAVLMWNNADAFALVTDAATGLALERSAVVLGASALLFAFVGLTRWAAPRARGLWATMFLLVAGASVAAPLALRGRGTPPFLEARPIDAAFATARSEPAPRVTVIAIDAASLDLITRTTAEGRLPNVARILDAHTHHRLANTALGSDEPSAVYPVDLQNDALAAMEAATAEVPAVVNASLGAAPNRADAREEAATRTDRIYDAIAQAMARQRPAQLTLVRYQSLDPI